ncbi:MAG: cysteine desulfurase [Candidatus Portnoybacteria bacterium]|nr:cysteine desulfurase [Candidatus Portnoybacteria bacterium]
MRIYLDYSASTPVAPEVREAMKPYFSDKFGNPSSMHWAGREAEIATDEAREVISRFFEVDFGEVYFTSGATESNNWIANAATSYQLPATSMKPHIIVSAFEHESVLEPIKYLEKKGTIEASYIKPSRDGFINPKDVEHALKENTVLVSIMYVNNEIGTIQPIKEIGKIIEKYKYKILNTKYEIPVFHTDAVQAIQFLEPRLDYLKVDAMTVSAHKIYGPKGSGALIAKKRVPLIPLLRGGGQEFEIRSGTLNVPAIIGFGKAVELLQPTTYKLQARIEDLKRKLKGGILRLVSSAKIVGGEPSAPHILSVIFPGIEAQVMLIALDQEGIAVSSGAACSTKAIKPSHVLLAMGYGEKEALSSIRFSLGRYTSEGEIDRVIEVVARIMKRFNRKRLNV